MPEGLRSDIGNWATDARTARGYVDHVIKYFTEAFFLPHDTHVACLKRITNTAESYGPLGGVLSHSAVQVMRPVLDGFKHCIATPSIPVGRFEDQNILNHTIRLADDYARGLRLGNEDIALCFLAGEGKECRSVMTTLWGQRPFKPLFSEGRQNYPFITVQSVLSNERDRFDHTLYSFRGTYDSLMETFTAAKTLFSDPGRVSEHMCIVQTELIEFMDDGLVVLPQDRQDPLVQKITARPQKVRAQDPGAGSDTPEA